MQLIEAEAFLNAGINEYKDVTMEGVDWMRPCLDLLSDSLRGYTNSRVGKNRRQEKRELQDLPLRLLLVEEDLANISDSHTTNNRGML